MKKTANAKVAPKRIGVFSMTKEECREVITIIIGAYPNFLMGRTVETVYKSWFRALKDSSYDETLKNLDRWIDENNTPPFIKNIKPWGGY